MLSRLLLFVVTLFWVTMNVLLWRAEYGEQPGTGSTLPARVVWQKMLTAPDSSSLSIWYRGKKVGFCHWLTSVNQELSDVASQVATEDDPLEGMLKEVTQYRVQLEGNVGMESVNERLRFDTQLTLSTNQLVQQFNLRLYYRPVSWSIQLNTAAQTIKVVEEEGDDAVRRVRHLKVSDFQDPAAALRGLVGPLGAGLVNLLPPIGLLQKEAANLDWQARHASLRMGHSPVPVYRLSARALDQFGIVIYVSRVGEILRAELPEGVVLVNDQLGGG
jgi:hypothetical protein